MGEPAYILLIFAVVVTNILFAKPMQDIRTTANSERHHTQLKNLQKGYAWVEALRNAVTLQSPLRCSSSLLQSLAARKKTLFKLQGCVNIGDLVRQRELRTHIVSLVATILDFDINIIRLEVAHQSTISHLKAFVSSFCTDFGDLLEASKGYGSQVPDHHVDRSNLGELTEARKRQTHTTKFRETKAHYTVVANSIRHAYSILFQDTVTELETSILTKRNTSVNPLLRIFKSKYTMRSNILSSMNLPEHRPPQPNILDSLTNLATSQVIIERQIAVMRHELHTIDAILTEFAHHISILKTETLVSQAKNLIELVTRLNNVIRLIHTYECDNNNED